MRQLGQAIKSLNRRNTRWLRRLVGVEGSLESTLWIVAAVGFVVLALLSSGGVGYRLHGLLLAVPWILILALTAIGRHRVRRHRTGPKS
jgi:hypothetical protein